MAYVIKEKYKELYPEELWDIPLSAWFSDNSLINYELYSDPILTRIVNYKLRSRKYTLYFSYYQITYSSTDETILAKCPKALIPKSHIKELPWNKEKWIYYLPLTEQLGNEIKKYQRNSPYLAKRLKYKEEEQIIKKELAEFYGENNIDIGFEEGRYIYGTVKYGDTVIANLSKKHKIYDLYIQYIFRADGNKQLKLWDIKGARLTLTKSESRSGYEHSHLHDAYGKLESFCLGSSPVSAFQDIPFDPKDKEAWDDLFMYVDHLVQFEDTGNPYRRISTISPLLNPPNENLNIFFLYNKIKEQIKFKYNTDSDLGYFSININEDEIDYNFIQTHFLCVKHDQKEYSYDNYLYHKASLTSKYQTIESGLSNIKFQGKILKKRIIRERKDSISDNLEPNISTVSKEKLSKYIQKHLFDKIYEKPKEKEQINITEEENQTSPSSEQTASYTTT